MKKTRTLRSSILLLVAMAATGFTTDIRPSFPTHLLFTPTAYLNNEGDLVASLHEISYTLPYKLQIHMSLVDNIGRNCFGVRYALADDMNVGVGIASSFTTFSHGGHGIKHGDSRLGLFLAYGFVHTRTFDAAVTPHAQIGHNKSLGADLGFLKTPNEVFSLIGEIGFSFDLTDSKPWMDLTGAVRIHPPKIPFLNFDVGIDMVESPIEEFANTAPFPYLDVVYTMKTK